MKVETIDRKEIVALYQFGKMPKELDEKEAEQLDKIVNKKYYEEQARLAKRKESTGQEIDVEAKRRYLRKQRYRRIKRPGLNIIQIWFLCF